MSTPRAICINCGADKRNAKAMCRRCRFRPTSDIDVAKSIYLSLDRFVDDDPDSAFDARMHEAQGQLRVGTPIVYDEQELQKILATKDLVKSIPLSAPFGALLRLWLPIFIVLLIGLLFRWLRAN